MTVRYVDTTNTFPDMTIFNVITPLEDIIKGGNFRYEIDIFSGIVTIYL